MYDPAFPLAYYYSWKSVSDPMIPNIMAEFREHGVRNLVFSNIWLDRILCDMKFWSILYRHAKEQGVNLVEAHAPWGQGYDLCCPAASGVPEARDHRSEPPLVSSDVPAFPEDTRTQSNENFVTEEQTE